MAITDELRKWAQVCGIKYDSKLYEIADNIDAAHCKALGETAAAAYAEGVESVPIAVDENAWVRLPVDADGVPIRVGDKINVCQTKNVEVVGVGDQVVFTHYYMGDYHKHFAGDCHHHRAPTVEDVLREFGDWYAHTKGGCDEDGIIAEYAAKLRLAGEGE